MVPVVLVAEVSHGVHTTLLVVLHDRARPASAAPYCPTPRTASQLPAQQPTIQTGSSIGSPESTHMSAGGSCLRKLTSSSLSTSATTPWYSLSAAAAAASAEASGATASLLCPASPRGKDPDPCSDPERRGVCASWISSLRGRVLLELNTCRVHEQRVIRFGAPGDLCPRLSSLRGRLLLELNTCKMHRKLVVSLWQLLLRSWGLGRLHMLTDQTHAAGAERLQGAQRLLSHAGPRESCTAARYSLQMAETLLFLSAAHSALLDVIHRSGEIAFAGSLDTILYSLQPLRLAVAMNCPAVVHLLHNPTSYTALPRCQLSRQGTPENHSRSAFVWLALLPGSSPGGGPPQHSACSLFCLLLLEASKQQRGDQLQGTCSAAHCTPCSALPHTTRSGHAQITQPYHSFTLRSSQMSTSRMTAFFIFSSLLRSNCLKAVGSTPWNSCTNSMPFLRLQGTGQGAVGCLLKQWP